MPEFSLGLIAPPTGPLSAWSFNLDADWAQPDVAEQGTIWWNSDNPLLSIPGANVHSFMEEVMHEAAGGVLPIINGGALV